MNFVLFYHSFVSCWNHGNAHFLRGICRELVGIGHTVVVYEPQDGWSRTHALREPDGPAALAQARRLVPAVKLRQYRLDSLDLEQALEHADVVIVHEWNSPELVAALSRRRIRGGRFLLLFHDTHHRAVSAPEQIDALDLRGFDGVLAFGEVLREIYARRGFGRRAFTWHEAADTALFCPAPEVAKENDVVFIGNWGDGERGHELRSFLFDPAARLGLDLKIYGVRYPLEVCNELAQRGVRFAGWLPNHRVPQAFARAKLTVHIPRAPYVAAMPGIPTIRVFEALACGIPLICSPWDDVEGLFPEGSYALARSAEEMTALISRLNDPELSSALASTGLAAVQARHSCAHRVGELLDIIASCRRARVDAAVGTEGRLEGALG